MKNTSPKMIALFVSALMILSMLAILPIGPTAGAEELPDYEPADWQTRQSGWQGIPTIEGAPAEDASVATVESFVTTPPVGTKAYDWYLESISDGTPTGNQPWMTLRAIGGNVEVWTQDYMWFLPGDPRNDPASPSSDYGYALKVTDEMCQYLADQFNNIIYPTDTLYFGMPLDRYGTNTIFEQLGFPSYYWDWIATDNPQRVIVKILNYRDTNYYNRFYPSYVVGFYHSTLTRTYYKRNMIHIDPWRFWQRVGPEGKRWFPTERPDLVVPAARAYLIDSTLAHEFQHNIHRDFNPNDATFMNEGCSDYAQLLCGYPNTMWSHINYYLYTPDNSLTQWGDQGDINILADYGAGCLWAIFLVDHYGGPAFLSHFVQAGIPGIAGVDAALAYFGYSERFDDVYHDWRIANLIHSDLVADGRYNYKSIDLGGPLAIPAFTHTISGLPVPSTKGLDFGTTWALNGYDTGEALVGPYGSDYIVLNNWDKMGIIYFDGEDTYGWRMTADGWWSGKSNLMDTLLNGQAYVDSANPTLEIVTKYDIEEGWDFGFVQVSADGGATWKSQSNAYTTMSCNPSAMPSIKAQLPGLTGTSPGWPVWLTMTFDLTAYAGKTVLIRFRYMTDSLTTGAGWYINDAKVSGTSLTLTPVPLPTAFQVSVVRVAITPNGEIADYIVNDVDLDASWAGTKGARVLDPNYVILVVSSVGRTGSVDYTFEAKEVPIMGDCNGDGMVNMRDISLVSAHWSGPPTGPLTYDPDSDINCDGVVNMIEVAIISADWGKSW